MAQNASTQSIEAIEATAAKSAKTRKLIAICGGGLAVIIIGILVYIFGIKQPGEQKSLQAASEVDVLALSTANDADSTIVAAYMDVADNYGYAGGSRAAYMAASGLYRQGKYEEALDYIKKYDGDDHIVASLAKGLEGDCYANLDRLDDAIAAFDKAINKADNNEFFTPYFMVKKATVLAAQGKNAEAAKIYEEVANKYPTFGDQIAAESRKLQQEALAK